MYHILVLFCLIVKKKAEQFAFRSHKTVLIKVHHLNTQKWLHQLN